MHASSCPALGNQKPNQTMGASTKASCVLPSGWMEMDNVK